METFIDTFSGGGTNGGGTNSFGGSGTGDEYEYNFSAVGGTGSSDLNSSSVLQISPWGGLSEVGFTSLEQVFRNPRGDLGSGSSNSSSSAMGGDSSAPSDDENPSSIGMGGNGSAPSNFSNTFSGGMGGNGSAPSNFGNTSSDRNEPLLVGTNTTGDLTLDLSKPVTNNEPLVVGSNSNVKITVIGGDTSSGSGTEPVVVGTNNTVIGAENMPSNGSAPLLVTTNSTVEFILGDDTSSSGTTPLVLGTNKTIGSEERVTDSNAPKNDANYQWELMSGAGGGFMPASGDSLTGGGSSMPASGDSLTGGGGFMPASGDSLTGGGGFMPASGDSLIGGGDATTASSNADFFRNLFGAGQAPNPDYTYDFGTQNSGGNFRPGGVDFSMSMGSASSSLSDDPFASNSSFGGGMTNSNNSGADLPIAGTNNTIL